MGSCLNTGQHSIFVIIRKIKRIIYVPMLDTLFIENFIDSMVQHFLFWSHDWQWNSVAQTKDLKQYLWYGIKNIYIYFIGKNKCIIKKNRVLAYFQTIPDKCGGN